MIFTFFLSAKPDFIFSSFLFIIFLRFCLRTYLFCRNFALRNNNLITQ